MEGDVKGTRNLFVVYSGEIFDVIDIYQKNLEVYRYAVLCDA